MGLEKLRREIDKIDSKIVTLLNKRAGATLKIGQQKKREGKSVFVPDRESQIYERIAKQNRGPLTQDSLKAIYREVMSGSLSLEKDIQVAYLGPQATFTHLAGLKKFGSSVKYVDCSSISEIFAEVESSHCDFGVVPIENSIEGAVTHTLDMLIDADLNICSEILLEISHNLLAKCKKDQIRKIYSNPQVFGQCRMWLEANQPRAQLIEAYSTTKAAQLASKTRYSACIASALAARLYKLKVIARDIEDSPHNVTRFLVIGRTQARPTKKDKTSIVFSIKDRVGALHDMLTPFKRNGINLTMIESRPSKKRAWDYYFFVDLEGHYKDKNISKAILELEKNCTYLKILGSYPVGE